MQNVVWKYHYNIHVHILELWITLSLLHCVNSLRRLEISGLLSMSLYCLVIIVFIVIDISFYVYHRQGTHNLRCRQLYVSLYMTMVYYIQMSLNSEVTFSHFQSHIDEFGYIYCSLWTWSSFKYLQSSVISQHKGKNQCSSVQKTIYVFVLFCFFEFVFIPY